jgi:hypothetical protein
VSFLVDLRRSRRPALARLALASIVSCLLAAGCGNDKPQTPNPAPVCSVSTATLAFDDQTIGGTSAPRGFTITNTGTGVLSGTVTETSPDFEIESGGGTYGLEAQESRSVAIRFCPQSPGPRSCTIDTGSPCGQKVTCSGTGVAAPQPVCTVAPTSPLEFGSVTVGECSSEQSFTVTNAGGGILEGTVGASCPDFQITSGSGAYSLAGGQSVTVHVRFCPQSAGIKTCTIDTGALCAPDIVATGVAAAAQAPVCVVAPGTPLDFGTIPAGESSAAQSFSIMNTGGGTLTGEVSAACPDFEIVAGGGAYALTAGQSVTVQVRFRPQSAGAKNCSVDTGTPCAQDVVCLGTGEGGPVCTVTPTAQLEFGEVEVGETSSIQFFSIMNTGGGTLTGEVSAACPDFEIVDGAGAYALTGGASHAVQIRFRPQSTGAKSCTVETGSACAQKMTCVGTGLPGVPVCAVTPSSSLEFGEVAVGQSSAERTFTVTNSGGGTLSGSIAASCDDFVIVSGAGEYHLTAGQPLQVVVRFSPQTAGVKSCVIATGAACQSAVTCAGTGLPGPDEPMCSITPSASLNFPSTEVGECSPEQSFSVQNTGQGTLDLTVSESSPDFELTAGEGAHALGAGQSVTVRVRFCPASAGQKNGTINLGSACSGVTCAGSGEAPPACSINETTIAFGTVPMRQDTIDRLFTITNSGGGTLNGTVGPASGDFQIVSGAGAYHLASGQTRTVVIRFHPTVCGSQSCSIAAGSGACPAVLCTGTGSAAGACSVSATALDFAEIDKGSCSESHTLTITNAGCDPINFTLSLTNADDFTIVPSGPQSLSGGERLDVDVRFCPTHCGALSGAVRTGLCPDVPCTGTSVIPFGASTAVLDFGSAPVGSTTPSRIIRYTNHACTSVPVDPRGNGDFTVDGGSLVLAPEESADFPVTFHPVACGTRECVVHFTNGDPGVSCRGVGGTVYTVSTTELDWGDVPVWSVGIRKTFSIQNSAGSCTNLSGNVTSVSSEFTVTSGAGAFSLAPGETRTIEVAGWWGESECGPTEAWISTGLPQGEQVRCVAQVTDMWGVWATPDLYFPDTPVGSESVARKMKVRNSLCVRTLVTITESSPDFYISEGDQNVWIEPGHEGWVDVVFAPQSCGARSYRCSPGTGFASTWTGRALPPSGPQAFTAAEDVSLVDGVPTGCLDAVLRVGGTSTPLLSSKDALVYFDVSSIPSCASVTNATLVLYADGCLIAQPSIQVDVQRVESGWQQCVVTGIPPSLGAVLCSAGIGCTAGDVSFASASLTTLVQDWVSGAAGNFGLELTSPAFNRVVSIHSSEASDHKPRLLIEYTCGSCKQ